MAALRPRELLGLSAPRLEAGAPADFVTFDWQPGAELRVRAVISGDRVTAPGGADTDSH